MIMMTTTSSSNKNKSMPEHSEAEDYDDFCLPGATCYSDHHEMKPPPPEPPRGKKRSSTKVIKMSNEASASTAAASTSSKFPKHNINVGSRKGKAAMVGDFSIPMTTWTCIECGKKFRSCKALYGHMRCHPERLYRGMNTHHQFRNNNNNSNIINKPLTVMIMVNPTLERSPRHQKDEYEYGEEDKEVASCLLMLANSTNATCTSATNTNVGAAGVASDTAAIRPVTLLPLMVQQQQQQQVELQQQDRDCMGETVGWFKSSRCKKVFGSHQALGGDRAGHKNVKGCFGINRSTCRSHHVIMDDNDDVDRAHDHHYHHHPPPSEHHIIDHDQDIMAINSSTNLNNYQALGGHKRCHLEKVPDHHQVMDTFFSTTTAATRHYHHHVPGALDLNFPAAAAQSTPQHQHQQLELQQHGSLYSPDQHPAGLTLNLRLSL